ncbi:MAG: cell division topological specificity factor MinE [Chloroflexi bacterium]|nr:cell division topological specificity factor MinE [Chloroflexota bacterium]
MAGFFDRMRGRSANKNSGNTAKERLQFILVHDRINLPPERMEMMKREILEVISKYVDVAGNQIDVALENRHRSSLLVAEVPVTKTNDDSEGQAESRLDAADADDA